ncbi:Vanillyl-alcohol oxidase [Exophiala dermatitidis]
MYRKRNGSLGFSFTRFANAAVPNFFADALPSHSGDLTAFRQDMCYMHQVTSADPYALDERSFYVGGIVDSEKLSKRIHKTLKKYEILKAEDGTVDTYKIGPRFPHQLAFLNINRQKDLVGLLFWWEEECQRLRKLNAEEKELDSIIADMVHNLEHLGPDSPEEQHLKINLDQLKFVRERIRMKKRQRPSQRHPDVEADRDDIVEAFHGRSKSVPNIGTNGHGVTGNVDVTASASLGRHHGTEPSDHPDYPSLPMNLGFVGRSSRTSGIPSRITEDADSVKRRFEQNATKSSGRGRGAEPRDLAVLPPGVTREKFNAAIAELRNIVENDITLVDGDLDDGWYLHRPLSHDAFALDQDDYFVNSAICAPANVQQVQAIMRWANKWLIPIYAISMGRNFGYGGASGRLKGSVLVDMGKRMNRVIELNENSAFCLLEPGVSYYKLYDEIQKSGKKLWVDVPDLGGGSVIGNALDRGVGYTPYGDHFGMHCGMEVVLPNGNVVRTGMGALPDPNTSHGSANTWQLFPYGFGPYSDGVFTQSNYGIVTKMGWGHQTFQITFPREDDLYDIVEIMRPLKIKNIIPNVPHLRHIVQEASIYGDRKTYWQGDGPIPHDKIEELIVPKFSWVGSFRWILYICVYGPEPIRKANIEVISQEFSKIPGARVMFPEETPENSYLRSRVKIYSGIPDLRELDWVLWLPNGSHTAFSPISPLTGEDAMKQYEFTKRLHQKWGFDYFPTFCPGPREMHHIVMIIYDRGDADSKRRARLMMEELVVEGAKIGMGEYRTHLALQNQVMATYNWNNGALLKFNNLLKDALDPNGVVAPGKSGIWGQCWTDTDDGFPKRKGLTSSSSGAAGDNSPSRKRNPEPHL